MDTGSIPLPGSVRLRPLRALLEPDGSCLRVFDLERASEVEVPQELRLHVASALDSGDFDEALLDWLVSAGLITSESWQSTASADAAAEERQPAGCVRVDGELHARLDLADDEGLPGALAGVFAAAAAEGAARAVLHVACAGALPTVSTLERVVLEAERQSHETGIVARHELALASPAVTTELVRFLAETPFHLRLAAEAPAGGAAPEAWVAAGEAARRVEQAIPGRITVQAVLGPGARLRDVARWARALPLQHLDAVPLGAHPGGPREADIAAYRDDLLALAEELAAALGRDPLPLDLQPLTSVARRLLRGVADGGAHRPRGRRPLAEARRGSAAFRPITARLPAPPLPAGDPRLARCGDCWGRRACARSAEITAPAGGSSEPGWGASPDLCGYRRAEVFAALELVRRIDGRHAFALRWLEEMAGAPIDPFAHAPLPWQALALA